MSNIDSGSSQPLLAPQPTKTSSLLTYYNLTQRRVKTFLSSPAQHYVVLTLVSLDLLGIFADIIINLYQCDAGSFSSHTWSDVREGLGIAGLVFSCLFMLELVMSVWAFGWSVKRGWWVLTRTSYFNSKFHIFDGLVILAGFVTDVLLHGVLEEVASLVVILRLWRFFKIIEEFSVGAKEQMDGLELRIEQLENENEDLKMELKRQKGMMDEEGEVGFGSGSGK